MGPKLSVSVRVVVLGISLSLLAAREPAHGRAPDAPKVREGQVGEGASLGLLSTHCRH